jgi:hypothetical protein
MVRGDSATFQSTISNLGISGLTGSSMWFTVKYAYTDIDAAKILSKTVGNGITIVQAGGSGINGIVNISINPADTANVPEQQITLVWDLQMKDTNGVVTTVDKGTLVVSPDVTQATT